jgi:hypothetical protein
MPKMTWTHPLRAAAAVFWGATALASASAEEGYGYLPAIGPAPLRFRPVPDRANAFIQLPLPEPANASTVPASPSSEQTEPANPFALSETLAPAAESGTNVMEAASPPLVAEAPTAEQQPISPRVFLQYFNGGTNAPGSSATAPVDFTPPRAGASGKAALSTSP